MLFLKLLGDSTANIYSLERIKPPSCVLEAGPSEQLKAGSSSYLGEKKVIIFSNQLY